jgi:hypothetical protein
VEKYIFLLVFCASVALHSQCCYQRQTSQTSTTILSKICDTAVSITLAPKRSVVLSAQKVARPEMAVLIEAL